MMIPDKNRLPIEVLVAKRHRLITEIDHLLHHTKLHSDEYDHIRIEILKRKRNSLSYALEILEADAYGRLYRRVGYADWMLWVQERMDDISGEPAEQSADELRRLSDVYAHLQQLVKP